MQGIPEPNADNDRDNINIESRIGLRAVTAAALAAQEDKLIRIVDNYSVSKSPLGKPEEETYELQQPLLI